MVSGLSFNAASNRLCNCSDEQVSELHQRHTRQQRQFRLKDCECGRRVVERWTDGKMEKQMICNSVYSAAVGCRGYATLKDSTRLVVP